MCVCDLLLTGEKQRSPFMMRIVPATADRDGLVGVTKSTKLYYTASLAAVSVSMNGGAAGSNSGAAVQSLAMKDRAREIAHMVCCNVRMSVARQCKSLKVKQSVSRQIGADARLANVG